LNPPFAERLAAVRRRIAEAASRAKRDPASVRIVAVTKSASGEALQAGHAVFAENRVQDAAEKITLFPEAEWHLIGHLQTNKAKDAVSLFRMIQSVDSLRLAKVLDRAAAEAGKVVETLVEVNATGESQKHGFLPDELYGALEEIASMRGLRVRGLMGMAPLAGPEERRAAFKELKNLFSVCKSLKNKDLDMSILSMGMSDDFELAVEEGSTLVRIGRALFA
jgi:PLP dependent protein